MSSAKDAERADNDIVLFLRTILMILENHNFQNTAQIFRNECTNLGYNNITPKPNEYLPDLKLPSPKIILENFTNQQPYRIVIQNTNKEQSPNQAEENLKLTKILDKDLDVGKNCVIVLENKNETSRDLDQNKDMVTEKLTTKFNVDKHTRINTTNSTSKNETQWKNSDYEILQNKFSILQVEHQKLMDIVTELTFALQTSIKGQLEDTHVILNECEKIYPELFYNKPAKNVNTVKNIQSNSDFVSNDLKQMNAENNNNHKPKNSLDFQKIKQTLREGDLKSKLLLLQALRWRITKSSDKNRTETLQSYVQNDILNIHSCFHQQGLIFPTNSIIFTSFYCSCAAPQPLQQSVARFLNAVASTQIGRDYLLNHTVVLNILMSVLVGAHAFMPQIDDIARDFIVAMLQKLSVRYMARRIMISEGLTEHLVQFLKNNLELITNYCLLYSVALLKNLWLHNASRQKCHPLANDIITMLLLLLNEQYTFCLPYVIGSLYNLLPDDCYYEAATNVNFSEIIRNHIEKHQDKTKDQFECILEVYTNPKNHKPLCECDFEIDYESEMDIIEPEIDQNEVISDSEETGEQFLQNYILTKPVKVSEFEPYKLSLPITPNQLQQPTKSAIETQKAQTVNEQINVKIQETNISQPPVTEMKPSEKSDIEITFCEDTKQFYYKPTKNHIFEPDEFHKLLSFSPSFLKKQHFVSKSSPGSPKSVTDRYFPFTAICYREGFKGRAFSDSAPHIGFCNKTTKSIVNLNSKYSCACYAEMQRSFDEEDKKNLLKNNTGQIDNKNNEKQNNSNFCRYKWFPAIDSIPNITSSYRTKKGILTSKSLDETDYTSVFESRPRILRTP